MIKFDAYFKERRNAIFDRTKFNTRCQKPGESADQSDLYAVAVDCKRTNKSGPHIVVGVAKLSERLQMDAALSHEKAKKSIRQAELVQQQKTTTRPTDAETPSVDVVKGKGRPRTVAT